jgi:hypothetical protein
MFEIQERDHSSLFGVIRAGRRVGFLWLMVLVSGLLFVSRMEAQTETGTIRGVVTDARGGVIQAAAVVVTNTDQGVVRRTVTDAEGGYDVQYLNPGHYKVSVEKSDFKTTVVSRIVLEVNQVARADVRMELGQVREQVTVNATESLLQSETTVVGGDVEQRMIEDLPGRSIVGLVSLSPSTAQLSGNGFGSNSLSEFQPERGGLGININIGGYRQTGNYYELDGVSNTDWDINAYVVQPSVESLSELRVQTSTNSAAFGEVPGGTVNVVTRSGTNHYHGMAYVYPTNGFLNARPYNFSSQPQGKPAFKTTLGEFGGALGGPVRVPYLYKGQDRTFFYVHYEGFRNPSSGQSTSSIPTALARTGDLSEYGRPIYDPLHTDAQGHRVAFAGGIIPADRIDPVALKVLSFMPVPTLPGTTSNLVQDQREPQTNNQENLRLDHQLNSSDSLAGNYHYDSENSTSDSAFGPVTGNTDLTKGQTLGITETHVFNPRLLNNLKFGYNRLATSNGVTNANKVNIIGALGIQGINEDPGNWGFPQIFVSGADVVTDASNRPTTQRDNNYQVIDDLTWQRGRHTFQFGGEFRDVQLNLRLANPSRGIFDFTGSLTAGPDPENPTQSTGLGLADFLLGYPLQASRTVGVPQAYLSSHYLAGYVGDTFRLRPHLTFLLGLRYDFFSAPTEAHHNYFNLDFATLPNQPPLVQQGTTAAHNLPDNLVQWNPHNFSPRVGVAWQPIPRTVVRSAYGIYSIQEVGALYYGLVSNGVITQSNNSSVVTPQLSTTNAFQNAVAASDPAYNYIDPHSVTPYVQEWNLGVQRELTNTTMLEVVYAASRGTHLFRARSFNTAFQTETGANLPPRPGDIQSLRTWPNLGPISEAETTANSIYHSLQIRLDKRFASGISFLNSFTWGKVLDDSDAAIADQYQSPAAQDERNLRAEWGLASFDIRKTFSSAILVQTPFGAGRRYLGTGIVGHIIGPWEISSIITAQDGWPQDLVSYDSLSTFGTMHRSNVVPGQPILLSSAQRKAGGYLKYQYYNPLARTPSGPLGLGNDRRNSGPTPGVFGVNFGLIREFKMPWEGHELTYRGDVLNAFNTVNLGIPDPDPTSTIFGQVLTSGNQRSVSMSLKYRF